MKKYAAIIFTVLIVSLAGCQNHAPVVNENNSTESSAGCTHIWGEWDVVTPPVCDADGENSRSCSLCFETETAVIPALNHEGTETTWTITQEANCTTEGSKDCVCSCGVVIRTESLPALGHTSVIDGAVAATCTSTGLTEGSHCSVCGEVLTKQNEIAVLEHTVVIDGAVAATCSSTGLTEGSHCSVCGEVLTKQKTVSQLNHTVVVDKGVAATCSSNGLTEGKHCSVCGKVLTKQKVLPAKGHNMAKKLVPTNGYDPEYTVHFCVFCTYAYKEDRPTFNHDNYSIDKLKFVLDDTYQTKLNQAYEKCLRIYNKQSLGDAGKLVTALYEMKQLEDEFYRQRDIADLLFYYNVTDQKLLDNYNYGYNAANIANSTTWDLFIKAYRGGNVFSDIVTDFFYSNYRVVDGPTHDVSAVRARMDAIENEFLQFNNVGTAEQVYEMYTEYLSLSHKVAEAYGYANYYEYASERVYHRDYGKEEWEQFREFVRDYFVPLYKELDSASKALDRTLSKRDYDLSIDYDDNHYESFGENYLYTYFDSLRGNAGSIMKNAFEGERILVGDGPNSYNLAFVKCIDMVPYCYFHKDRMDLSTMAHELGHYYASTAIGANVPMSQDIYEVHSEGNVMLMFRCLAEEIGTPAFDSFVAYKLSEMAYQAIYAAIRDEFDEIMLSDPNAPNFTLEEIDNIMEGLLEKYNATDISQRFTEQQMTYWHRLGLRNPGYDISYAVSFVVTYQLYCNSGADYQAAAQQYDKLVNELNLQSTFLATIENAGLFSPFDERAYTHFKP